MAAAAAKLLQSCPTLCDPTDRDPPGSPVPGVLQARILEWVAIAFSSFQWRELKNLLHAFALHCPIAFKNSHYTRGNSAELGQV